MDKKLIILDRDGVINFDSNNYIKSLSELNYIPGSLEAIAKLHQNNYIIGVATNQSAISRGLLSLGTLNELHQKILDDVRLYGGKISHIEYCPHLPDDDCFCRKPKPGMLIKLAEIFSVNLENVYFVGDRLSDVDAALCARAKPVFLAAHTSEQINIVSKKAKIFSSLSDFVNALIC